MFKIKNIYNWYQNFWHSKFIMFNFNWYQDFHVFLLKIGINIFCLFPFNWYRDAILWHIFNWYLNWLSPLFGFVFVLDKKGENIVFINPLLIHCFEQKKGRKIYWFGFAFTLYWWLFLCIKKGRRFCLVLIVYPFVDDWQKGGERV